MRQVSRIYLCALDGHPPNAGQEEREQTSREAESAAASLDALIRRVGQQEAALQEAEEALAQRRARLTQATDATRQELLALRAERKQVSRRV